MPLKNAFFFERVSDLQLQNDLRRSPTNLDAQVAWTQGVIMMQENGAHVSDDERSFLQKEKDEVVTQLNKFQWLWFWSYTDEVRGLQMWQTVINGTQMLGTNNSFQSVQSFLETNFYWLGFVSVKNNPYAIISQDAHGKVSAIRKLASVQTVRNIVITAIALKRYELRNHQLPNTLDELVPEFLKSVPTDYMDGQPLRYRRNADGTFLLYSVGENGKDDGGNPALKEYTESSNYYDWQNSDALDWLWPQPATEQEIQNYYAHPLK
jgi:hypothetical protein